MCRWRWPASRVEYVDVYRVGPPPPRGLYGAPRPAYLANLPPPQRRGGGRLARASCRRSRLAIPLVAALAPAPRRALPPDAPGRGGRQGGFGPRGGNPNRGAPSVASQPRRRTWRGAPNAAIAPSTVTPPPGADAVSRQQPSAGLGSGGTRPGRASGPRAPPAGHRGGAPPSNAAVAPSAVAPNPLLHRAPGSATPSPGGRRPVRRPPVAGRLRALPTARRRGGSSARSCCSESATPNAVGPAPRQQPPVGAGRPPVDRRPASPTARRQPARRRNPPRRQRGLKGHRRRRTGPPPQASPPPRPQATAGAGEPAAATAGAAAIARRPRRQHPSARPARAAAGCRGCCKAACTAAAATCRSGAGQATGLSARKVRSSTAPAR